MKTLLTFLVWVVEVALLLAAVFVWSSAPVQGWVRRRIVDPTKRRVAELGRRRHAMAQRHAEILLTEARDVLPGVATGRVPRGQALTPVWVRRWWYAAQLSIPRSLIALVFLELIVWKVGAHAFWENPRPTDPETIDPVGWIVERMVAIPGAVRAWDGPADAFEALRWPLAILIALTAVPIFLRIARARSEGPEQRQRREQSRTWKGLDPGDYVRCWPVVVLLTAAVQCARAYKQWGATPPGDNPPRVSMRAVERVIWRAHRTRRAKARSHHERILKAHSAHVVGALRAAEVKQDVEQERALLDLTAMLLTIAERYAEGRLGQLLDDQQIGDATPVVPRERLRMLAVGAVAVLVMAGAAWANFPEPALLALLPVVVLGAGMAINRGKRPTPAELTDLLIPR